jgi:hypothetical protein
MAAAIVGPDRKFMGCHRTWLDPQIAAGTLPEGSSGKATIIGLDNDALPAKKMRGLKRGGAIRLNDPRHDCKRIILLVAAWRYKTPALSDCRAAWDAIMQPRDWPSTDEDDQILPSESAESADF